MTKSNPADTVFEAKQIIWSEDERGLLSTKCYLVPHARVEQFLTNMTNLRSAAILKGVPVGEVLVGRRLQTHTQVAVTMTTEECKLIAGLTAEDHFRS